ncbi:hypothetical protein AU196_17535 [Mycobacterium sp. IS-1742]|uniref:WGxxGxxG family protein n=1 Tax=Mycobacterium sp. IS-1742 TaxID=1772285 RepID=UPI000740350B|nr:WGxxGxxG family protein [Mycobacterium sp. IS-1742]KUI28379.1 hypothetical protein AU196_17535 [Mycobacterium sp. IS-1742]
MREIVAVAAATGALLFGGAGVANATTTEYAPVQGPTTTLVAQADEQEDGDNTGLWGLAGLLGLLGLLGLKPKKDRHVATTPAPGTPGYGTPPRA